MRETLAQYHFLGNDLCEWLISGGIILGAFVITRVVFYLSRAVFKPFAQRTKTKLDDILFDQLEGPVVLAIVLAGVWIGVHRLEVSEAVMRYMGYAYRIMMILNGCWFVTRVADGLMNEYLIPAMKRSGRMDVHVVEMLRKTVKAVVWTMGIVAALNSVGIHVGTLLAGLGIGGIAFALAAQDTIKNIFAGIVIIIDRPFRIGDRIVVNGNDGYVEEIGLRSVKLRQLNGQRVTMSSAAVIDAAVVNISAEPAKRISVTLGLTYDTTPEEMDKAIGILKSLPGECTLMTEEVYVYFSSYGDFSLTLTYLYHIRPGADFFETQSAVNLLILRRFNEAGLQFAYPTSTVYVKRET